MFIASMLLDVIDVDSLHGTDFLSNTNQATLYCGRSFLAKIKQLNIIKSDAEERYEKQQFDAMTVFSINMAPAEAERNAHIAITKFMRLRVYNLSDPIAIQHMLVNKLPAMLADKKECLEELLYTSKASSSAASSYSVTAIDRCHRHLPQHRLNLRPPSKCRRVGKSQRRARVRRTQPDLPRLREKTHLHGLPYNLLGVR
jgi:hypothetical protein